jgi:amino acid transporter
MTAKPVISADSQEMQQLGYKPELPRNFKLFTSFAIGFSFISVTAGVFGSFSLGLSFAGGFVTFGWLICAVGQTIVALVFGMLATRIPLAGSSYQWVSRMVGSTAGWMQGWAFLTFVNISLLAVNYTLASSVAPALFGYVGTVDNTLLITACLCLLQALILIFSTALAGHVNNVAVVTEILGTVGLSIALVIALAVHHDFNWANLFRPEVGHTGSYFSAGTLFHSGWWQLALLMGIYAQCGFEGSADMSEETKDASRHVPRAMWMSMAIAGIVGFLFIGMLVVASPNLAATAKSATPIADIVNGALGSVVGHIFLAVVAFSVFACGLIIFMDTTRIVFAMARDERMPGSRFLGRIHGRLNTPLFAVIAVGVLDLILLFAFGRTTTALNTIVGVTSVLPPIMYGGPCVAALFRIKRLPKATDWSLGRAEYAIIVASVIWIAIELFTLRDSSLKTGWLYVLVAFAIGAAYLIVRRFTRGPLPQLSTEFGPSSAEVDAQARALRMEPPPAAGDVTLPAHRSSKSAGCPSITAKVEIESQ